MQPDEQSATDWILSRSRFVSKVLWMEQSPWKRIFRLTKILIIIHENVPYAVDSAEYFPISASRALVIQQLKGFGAPAYKAEGRLFRRIFEQKTGPCDGRVPSVVLALEGRVV